MNNIMNLYNTYKLLSLKGIKNIVYNFSKIISREQIFLTGELGSGKTTFVQYLLTFLNVSEKL